MSVMSSEWMIKSIDRNERRLLRIVKVRWVLRFEGNICHVREVYHSPGMSVASVRVWFRTCGSNFPTKVTFLFYCTMGRFHRDWLGSLSYTHNTPPCSCPTGV